MTMQRFVFEVNRKSIQNHINNQPRYRNINTLEETTIEKDKAFQKLIINYTMHYALDAFL